MKINKLRLLQPLLLLAFAASGEAAVTIYPNPFVYPAGTGGGSSINVADAGTGWNTYQNNGGSHSASTGMRLLDTAFPGAPENTYGALILETGGSGPTAWAATTGLNIDSTQAGLTFNWTGGNNNTATGVRLLVQVAGVWYASNQFYTVAASSSIGQFAAGTNVESFSYEFSSDPTGWSSVQFATTGVAGSSVASNRTQATEPLVGDITGVGFLKQPTAGGGGSGGLVRISDFHITAIPEPSVSLLGAIGALGLLRRRRNG